MLLTEGPTAEALGRRLGISPRIAGKHLENIYRKLEVCDRLMAVRRAYELGLLAPTAGSRDPSSCRGCGVLWRGFHCTGNFKFTHIQ